MNTGDVYGAKAAWQSALGVNRTYCKAHANLGFLAQSRGQIEEAVVEFTTTLSYCPNNLVAHYGLGSSTPTSGEIRSERSPTLRPCSDSTLGSAGPRKSSSGCWS